MSKEESPEELVQQLDRATQLYEELDAAIDALLSEYGGRSENLSEEAYDRYRALAEQRANAYTQMKALERALFDEA